MVSLGDVYWLHRPSAGKTLHLYFVITTPVSPDSKILLVNATTKREGSDLSCELEPGDHPRITHESVIQYGEAFVITARDLERAEQKLPGHYKKVEPASPSLIRRIQEAGLKSPHLAERYKQMIREELGLTGDKILRE